MPRRKTSPDLEVSPVALYLLLFVLDSVVDSPAVLVTGTREFDQCQL